MIRPKSRTAAIALLVAAVAIVAGIVTRSWFTTRRGDSGLGLTGIQECHRDGCESASWGDLPSVPAGISTFGYIGFAAGLLAAIGCAVVGAMMLAGRARQMQPRQVGAGLGGALTIAGLGQLVFVNRVMDTGSLARMSIGWSSIVALAGALAAAIVLRTLVMPALAAETDAVPAPVPVPQPYTIA